MRKYTFALLFLPVLASAQLSVPRAYQGVGRGVFLDVKVPTMDAKSVEIQLLEPVSANVIGTQSVRPGRNDIQSALPKLDPKKSPGLLYAQLVVEGKKVGSAVVLQPMLNPVISRLKPDGKTVEFVPDEDGPMFNGYRTYLDQNLLIETSMGKMEFHLRPDAAPNTAWNIRELAKNGFYTDSVFHRIVAKRADGSPFVIQGGDPTGTGSGGPGFAYPLEDSPLPHDFGVISIARSTDPNTNGGQFFVCLSRRGTKHLDHRYAAFGQCIRGTDVILKLGAVPVGAQDRPKDLPKIHRVRLVNAAPYGEGPKPVTRPDDQN